MLARGSLCASSHRSPEGAVIIASNTVVILTTDLETGVWMLIFRIHWV